MASPPPPPATFAGQPMAAWGYRVAAFCFDVGLALAAGFGTGAILESSGVGYDTAGPLTSATIVFTWLLITAGASALTGGQTLGKAIVGTRVLRETGAPARLGFSLLRDSLLRLLYLVPFFFLIDSVWPLQHQRRALRDLMLGTYVIKEPTAQGRVAAVAVAAVALNAGWIALVATGRDTGTDSFDRQVFVETCTDDGGPSEATCNCRFSYIDARLPGGATGYDESSRGDRAVVVAATRACP